MATEQPASSARLQRRADAGLLHVLWLAGSGHRVLPTGWLGRLVSVLASCGSLIIAYMAVFSGRSELLHVGLFLAFLMPIAFLTTTASRAIQRITWTDGVLALVSFLLTGAFVLNEPRYHNWMQGLDQLTGLEMAGGMALVVIILEMVRRTTGWPLLLIACAFLSYVALGPYLPGTFSHGGVDLRYFLEMQTITMDGLIGVPLYVAATYAFLFVLFGTFFQLAGGGQLFFDVAAATTGRFVGGPAKACVVSSALYGSVSGSPVADVATTGPITIPLMERYGISKKNAAAIEAAASSGGALLPPVMGAVAFLMADMTGIPYREILVASFLSAVIYYVGVFTLVHFECRRVGTAALAPEERVGLPAAIRRGWPNLVPVVFLTYLLLHGFSAAYVAAAACLITIITSWIARRHAIGPIGFVQGCVETCYRIVPLAAAVAVAGIVIGSIEMTGLSSKVASLLFSLTGGLMVPSLLVSALILIVLGMGMPTVAVYVMGAALLAPVLIGGFGFSTLGTHMFLLYFSCMSAITPPIAVACFTAASIANTDPFSVAPYASKLAVAGYLLPFFFILNPGLLMEGGGLVIAGAFIAAISMVLCVSVAIHGWFLAMRLGALTRLVFVLIAVLLVAPYTVTQALAVGLTVGLWSWCLARARRKEALQAVTMVRKS